MAEPHANTKHILPDDAAIVACLNEGMGTKQIAEHFGVGYEPMVRRIRNHGLRLQVTAPAPVEEIVKRHGIVIDKRRDYVLGRNEFREMSISLPALSILEGCERYGSAA